MKASARSQKIQVVTASDYLEFMKCPMKVHGSVLSERLFHDIPSCSPPTSLTKASWHAPPGPPPGPLAPNITSWSGPVKICKPGQSGNPWGTIHEPLHEICSPPAKISKAGKGVGDATTKVVTGFNIEQSFRRLSCEENNDSSEDKGKLNEESSDSMKHKQKENITKNSNKNENIPSEKETNIKRSINYVISTKLGNMENSENENPWITVKTKPGPCTQSRAKTNKENKTIPPSSFPSSFQSKLTKQLSEGANKLPSPSEDFATKFALRLLQNQPQTQQLQKQPQNKQSQQKQQQHRPQKERRQSLKQKIDKKENCDALRGSPNLQWRIGGQRDPRFQPEWRMSMEQDLDNRHSRAQQLMRKRTRSESKHATGTRIIYERKFLMQCRASPLAKTPPANLPNIPGITTKDSEVAPPRENGTIPEEPEKTDVDDDQFEMDL